MKLFSVYDDKAMFYSNPFPAHTTPEAMRMFAQSAKNPEIAISHHPEDYSLYHIGEFNADDGRLSPIIPAVYLCRASELLYDRKSVPQLELNLEDKEEIKSNV